MRSNRYDVPVDSALLAMLGSSAVERMAFVDNLLSLHKAQFGDARMEEGTGDGAAGAGTGDGAAGDAAAAAAAAQKATDDAAAAAAAAKGKAAEGKVEDLPDWAQRIIKDTRSEAASNRTKATDAEQKQAQILEGIAQALGIKKGDDAPTPEQLAKQLADSEKASRANLVELSVFKAAATAGADPVALTDSRAFMTKVSDLDPAAKDFAAKVKAEIETAVKDNPKLKSTQAAGASSTDHAGGSGERQVRKDKGLDQAVAGHYGT